MAVCADSGEPHWSLRPIADPAIPEVKDKSWERDLLDRFVLAKLEDGELTPNPDADRHQLLRRVTFDLTGLPPSPQEIDGFINDKGTVEAALLSVVKRLLDSPRFGERWARHWLDVARYADTAGGERPRAYPMAWKYRDWVIDALNSDMPYSRFVGHQIAGDLAPRPTQDMQTATAFLTIGANDLSMIRKPEFSMERTHEQIDTTTKAFLGLTVGCARCHDHKADPIKQTDYYALAGIFLSSKMWLASGGDESEMRASRRMRMVRGKTPVEMESMEGMPLVTRPSVLPSSASKEIVVSRRSEKVGLVEGNGDDLLSIEQRTTAKIPIDPLASMGVTDSSPTNCALRFRGEFSEAGPMVHRGDVRIPGLPQMPLILDKESGRFQLANWIISPSNPLTTRVIVNRIWSHLFGRGIVTTPDDFGVMGDVPTHPGLLDHLAMRFMNNEWSLKKMIRIMVMSRTYRMSSAGDPIKQQIDPGNKGFWRMNWKRLDAEALRDSWLQLSNQLKFDRPIGSQVGMLHGDARPLVGVSSPFRSIYLPVVRNGRIPELMKAFDFPDPSQVSGRRDTTTSAPQALFLMNSAFMEQAATDLASQVFRVPAAQRPATAYMLVFNRPPSAAEAADALLWVKESTADSKKAWALFVQAMLASPEFQILL